MRNERLETALRTAKERLPEIEARSCRTHFTTETAKMANAKKYASVPRKPRTATVRVEADIIELVKSWPTSERVHRISEAIRSAIKSS